MPLIADLKVWADLEILTAVDLNAALSEIRTKVNSFAAFKDQAQTFTAAQTFDAGITITGTATATAFAGSGAGLTALPAAQLTGTVPDAAFPATLPAASGANLTALPAANLTGTLPDGVFPATLPAASGANLTALPAANLTGTLPGGVFPATLPAASGANLTALNASSIASGTLASARLPSTIAANTTGLSAGVLSGSNTLVVGSGEDYILTTASGTTYVRNNNGAGVGSGTIFGPTGTATRDSANELFLRIIHNGTAYYIRMERWG